MSLTRIARVKQLSRPLLVTFDAYGTLYQPRAPVPLMYKQVAEEHGLRVESDEALSSAFSQVFRLYSQQYPNYGKGVLNDPNRWWEMVIRDTFEKCKVPGYTVPKTLIPDLISRFSGAAFYTYVSAARSTIKTLRNIEGNSKFPIIIGVVTNSDPRVASILRSFNFRVADDAPMESLAILSESENPKQERHQRLPPPLVRARRPDFDFVLCSYDANCEKPQERIFKLAERYAATMMQRLPPPPPQDDSSLRWPYPFHQVPAPPTQDGYSLPWPYPFHRLHVGDDMAKDVIAAKKAGWKAVYFQPQLRKEQLQKSDPEIYTCRDFMRGVKKATLEWVELLKVKVEMEENEKESVERERKELKKMEKLDPQKLAEAYERRLDEDLRDSTPETLGGVSSEKTETKGETDAASADSMSGHFMRAPNMKKPSSKAETGPLSHIFDWHAAGVDGNLTNESTSFLRPTNLQSMRKLRDGSGQQNQIITRSAKVRAKRARSRHRRKLFRRMEDRSKEPVTVEESAVRAYLDRKREMLKKGGEDEQRSPEEGRKEQNQEESGSG